jgi:hypothetical protein
MAVESVTKALQDAKIPIQKIDQACVGYVYGNGQLINKFIIKYVLHIGILIICDLLHTCHLPHMFLYVLWDSP